MTKVTLRSIRGQYPVRFIDRDNEVFMTFRPATGMVDTKSTDSYGGTDTIVVIGVDGQARYLHGLDQLVEVIPDGGNSVINAVTAQQREAEKPAMNLQLLFASLVKPKNLSVTTTHANFEEVAENVVSAAVAHCGPNSVDLAYFVSQAADKFNRMAKDFCELEVGWDGDDTGAVIEFAESALSVRPAPEPPTFTRYVFNPADGSYFGLGDGPVIIDVPDILPSEYDEGDVEAWMAENSEKGINIEDIYRNFADATQTETTLSTDEG